jgi:hypothetical protein
MGHAIYTLLFVVVVRHWLAHELGRGPELRHHRGWLVAVVAVQLTASALSAALAGVLGNALLHGLGGGVAAALVFVYLLRIFAIRPSWPVQLVGLFVFVSTLGVLNELGEYAVELLHLAVYSEDTHDTWRDFVANTTGAFIGFGLAQLVTARRRRPAGRPGPVPSEATPR